ncbi:MAG: TRAP transporter small permease [Chloroflexi bacterium]|nr:TRAP transporter small permease [Chloroflexota bacterium]
MLRLARIGHHLVEGFCVLLLVGFLLITLGGVIGRELFKSDVSWYQESARYLFIWLSLVGVGAGLARGAHFSVTVLVRRLPSHLLRPLLGLHYVLIFVFAIVMVTSGARLARASSIQVSTTLGLSMSWVMVSIAVSGGLIAFYALAGLYRVATDRDIAIAYHEQHGG